jgi:integrase
LHGVCNIFYLPGILIWVRVWLAESGPQRRVRGDTNLGAENGTDITFIQKLLGHNDIKTTLRYTHVSNKDTAKIESPLDKIMRKKEP